MSKELIDSLDMIATEKATKILPENIKSGVTILGVNGSYEPTILDVSDDSDISISGTTLVIDTQGGDE